MRGDSIRDLYAKTLALMGLGLLAGVGALVDYWPVGVGTPQVSPAGLAMPEVLAVGPARDVTIPMVVPRSVAPGPVARVAALSPRVGVPALAATPIVLSEPVAVPEVVVTDAVAPMSAPAAPVVEVARAEPAVPPGPDFDPDLVYQMGASRSDESGLLADAMDMVKSTGSTIARGGAITGASIVGAFRAVSDAFKKLKFF